ncbi:hypothetical protein KIH39_12475 [Telmatocola sphagniphila]|uniref:Vitellogenin n=1 Tax=Telmatocola sphagniphila TaxID=1123043 RepID=A0A8E6EV99_9BACT|nr:hypothetical protein [Telmatocola sphagniphila]QVL34684.1 hypothetical protein KIH39_12475 [Telmatocola sphagniphila]
MRPNRSISRIALLAGMLLLGASSGCSTPNAKVDNTPKGGLTSRNNQETPTAEVLVKYLSRQSSQIQMLDYRDISMEVTAQGRRAPSIEGYLVCEKARNFRLAGKVFGAQQVDLGSNNEQFWYWVKQSPEPHIFYCNYTDFERGVRLPFPFQPEWVLDVLGMGEVSPPENYTLEVRGNHYELTEKTQSQGQPISKVTIINRYTASAPVPQIVGKELRDSRNQLIAKATIKRVQLDRQTNLVVPKVVVLEYPAQQISMTLTLDNVTVNGKLSPQESARLFRRPNWNDVKSVDLAQLGRPTSGIRQVGANYR